MTMLEAAYWITQVLLAAGALCAVYRVYRGPSVLDRVISVDVILIIVGSVMLADMAFRRHQDFILFVVVTAVIGFLGAVAIARYVAVRTPDSAEAALQADQQAAALDGERPGQESAPAREPAGGAAEGQVSQEENESTSWFTALTKSGFRPRRTDQQHRDGQHDGAPPDADQSGPEQNTPGRDGSGGRGGQR
ncbi:monovalent cation/H+ antiporter complex subunit F [Nesterenkonia sp.]|uniref:monovalent cation/H+ antiporter complex subunit F n=1 Tax=Nesterenkonia sp. TaxID=704201 RepID=UPI002628F246|nr:monovalent cation/H+ antiporter complex subunit F [Nesterenkonia sp.]